MTMLHNKESRARQKMDKGDRRVRGFSGRSTADERKRRRAADDPELFATYRALAADARFAAAYFDQFGRAGRNACTILKPQLLR